MIGNGGAKQVMEWLFTKLDGKSHLDGETYDLGNNIMIKNNPLSLKIFTQNG